MNHNFYTRSVLKNLPTQIKKIFDTMKAFDRYIRLNMITENF